MSNHKYLFSLIVLLSVFMVSIFTVVYTLDTGSKEGYLIGTVGTLIFGYGVKKAINVKNV